MIRRTFLLALLATASCSTAAGRLQLHNQYLLGRYDMAEEFQACADKGQCNCVARVTAP